MGVYMEKSKYSIQKRVVKNTQLYDLVKDDKVLFTTDNYNEALFTFNNTNEFSFTDEQIMENINKAKERIKIMRENEIEQKYERPGTSTDMFVLFIMLLSVVGFSSLLETFVFLVLF
jgi:hypothetical protein